MAIQETIGRALSAVFAPFTFLTSLVRGDRIFHPDGVVYLAEARPLAQDGRLGELAQRLAKSTALVRLSGGLWPWPQSGRRPDVLGISMRFRSEKSMDPKRIEGDQDLLFVTSRTLPGLVIAPFTTRIDDFLDNRYHAILPFYLEGVGEVYLRLLPEMRSPSGYDRRDRLARAVERGTAVLRMEIQLEGRRGPWAPLVAIRLIEKLQFDDDALEFDPGSAGMGLVPYGVLQSSRPATYKASQSGRRIAQRRRR